VAEAHTTDNGERLPQPTEEVHLPDPSYLPVLVALAVWIILIGVTVSWVLVGIGAVILLPTLYRWIRSARREMRELPLEH
jgi:Flp pilus assembly protein TadB